MGVSLKLQKRREVGISEPLEPAQITSIYGTIEETVSCVQCHWLSPYSPLEMLFMFYPVLQYQECKKPGYDDSPFKEPSAQLDQLYDDLATMQCLEIPRKFLTFV